MSDHNLELVRGALFPEGSDLVTMAEDGEFQNALDPAAFAADVEVHFAQPSGPGAEYRGFDQMLDAWRDWLAPWASFEIQIEDMIDAGEHVVVLLAVLRGTTIRDHVEVEQQGASVVRLAGGKISRIEYHLDRRDAFASAGLSA